MRHTNQKHCIFARIGRGLVKGAPGMLLKHIVDVLHARDVALANAICSLVKPPNRRTERNSVIPKFPFGF